MTWHRIEDDSGDIGTYPIESSHRLLNIPRSVTVGLLDQQGASTERRNQAGVISRQHLRRVDDNEVVVGR